MSEEFQFLNIGAQVENEHNIRKQRQNYYVPDLGLPAISIGTRGNLPIFFDFSIWQRTSNPDGTVGTGVDWKTLSSFPAIAGGICKIGQPYGSEKPMMSTFCDRWFDATWEPNFQGLHDNNLFRGGYIYHHTAWPLDNNLGVKNFDAIWDGTIEEVAQKLITNDPNIYVAARKMTRLGRVFTASMMKNERRDWVADEIAFDFESAHTIGGNLIGDFWASKSADMTLRGMEFLMDNGYLKRHKMLVYSSAWFFNSFGLKDMRAVLDRYDSWVAGYYWNEKLGYRDVTIPGLVDDLNSIPDSWHAEYFGAVEPGDVVFAEQISSAHTMPYVRNQFGGRSAVDVNVCRIGWDGMFNRYPEFAKRYKAHHSGVTPPPPPPPPPPIEITTKTATVLKPVNMRKAPAMNGRIETVATVGSKHEVLETKNVGTQKWHRTRIMIDVWMAETTPDGLIKLLSIENPTV